MSIAATTWALHDAPTTSAQELVILWALADAAHHDGTAAFPKQSTLAKFGRCDERTVRRHLKAMEARGLIRRGDQRLVAHLPRDKRPVVWDLNMSMRRDDESEPVDNSPKRPDNLSPRDRTPAAGQPERPDTGVPSRGDHGVRSRGDTGVLQNRPVEPSVEPEKGSCVTGVPHQAPAPAVDNPAPVAADPDEPPAPWCPDHPGNPGDVKCGRCKDHRLEREAWNDRAARARAAERRAELAARNEAAAAAITACGMCDRNGFVSPGVQCVHDAAAIEIAREGSAKVRAVLAATPRRYRTSLPVVLEHQEAPV
ncbi:helix-turn-helix domain-containing protein [Nocardia africana]